MTKKELRELVRAKKRQLSEQQIVSASERLGALLRENPAYQSARSIYGYLAFNQEVRTMPMLEQAQKDGKRVAVPKVFGDEMRFIWLDDLNAVSSGYYNIPEPIANEPVADDETALVLMPGLAFDAQGHRCGYGGGFYDRAVLRAQSVVQTESSCVFFGVPYGSYVLSENGAQRAQVEVTSENPHPSLHLS